MHRELHIHLMQSVISIQRLHPCLHVHEEDLSSDDSSSASFDTDDLDMGPINEAPLCTEVVREIVYNRAVRSLIHTLSH